jgi:hypothetical protein
MKGTRWSLANPLDAFTKISDGNIACGAYLASDDGLRIGWEFRELEVCLDKAVLLYTMPSGFQESLCQHHASRYLPKL